MRGILDNLFDLDRTRDETPGEALHFRIWELFIGFQAARYAWVWGLETLRITDRAYIIHEGEVFRSGTPAELAGDETVKRVFLGADFRLD